MALIWAPLENLKDSDLSQYQEFANSACLTSGACNVDRALRALYTSNGDIKVALEKLLTNDAQLCSINHDCAIWTEDERQSFERLLNFHGKNFSKISLDMGTKSIKECVEFYYLWKNTAPRSTRKSLRSVGVTRVHPTVYKNSNDGNNNSVTPTTKLRGEICDTHLLDLSNEEYFPCKVCGRAFYKIKSRSAHMKRHKNEKTSI